MAQIFEEKRLEYCKHYYERFLESRSALHKKATFISSFNALLLTGFFFRFEYLLTLCSEAFKNNEINILQILTFSSLFFSGLFVFSSTIAILFSAQIIPYLNPFSEKFSDSLFSPKDKKVPDDDTSSLLEYIAMHYAFITDENMKILKTKIKRIRIAHYCSVLGISMFALFIISLVISYTLKGN